MRWRARLARAGMSSRDVLASLTAPAERFGESSRRGQVAAGLQEDLALFADDPARDIRALAAVRYTLCAGKLIWSASE